MIPARPGYNPEAPGLTPEERRKTTLEALLTRTQDALTGFKKMVEKAEPSFRPTAEQFRDLHARHANELAGLVSRAGGSPESAGSLMGTINKAVVTAKAFFDDIDEDVMAQISRDEDTVIEAFHAALKVAPEPQIAAMRDELLALLDDTRARAEILHQSHPR
jgi:uncharacterized protein (TIGR02284 family)